jgi:hypothetical protein
MNSGLVVVLAVEEKDRFVHVFVNSLAEGPLQKSSSSHFLTPEQTAVRICENLRKNTVELFLHLSRVDLRFKEFDCIQEYVLEPKCPVRGYLF